MLTNVLYILPMLLGRTFDARSDRVGFDIFPQSELDRVRLIREPETISRYETTESRDAVQKLLEVSGDLALKVKAGKVDLKGTGSYLKDASRAGSSVEILTKVKFTTVTLALPPDVKPFEDWLVRYPKSALGTHFVRSVSYGGELVAAIRFRANNEKDLSSISALVKGTFSGGETDTLVAKGKLEMVQNKLKDVANMEISYYATVPLKGVPNTIDGLRELVSNFGDHVTEVNNGRGVPIRVELMELEDIADKRAPEFRFLKNRALEAALTEMEEDFDDLTTTSARLAEFIRSLPPNLTPKQEQDLQNLYTRIQNVMRPFYDAIGKLNIEEGTEQLDKAKEAYREGNEDALPGRFNKELERIKERIEIVEPKLYNTGTSTYTRWGKTDCPDTPETVKMYTGYASSTTSRGTGGASEYVCLPEQPMTAAKIDFGSTDSAHIAGIRYDSLSDHPFDTSSATNYFGHGVPCTVCHLKNRTLVTMFPAHDRCPTKEDSYSSDRINWIEEYSGYIMSGGNLPGTYICMDSKPQDYSNVSEEHNTHSIGIAYVGNTTVPSGLYTPRAALKCVVCSK